MNNTGIYLIKNLVNGKLYVGSAVNLKDRFTRHRYMLKARKHHSSKLQKSYNLHGVEKFEYGVIQYCNKEDLIKNEQYWIDFYDSYKNGYNGLPKAQSRLNRKHSQETKDKIGLGNKPPALSGKKHPNFGKKMSEEQKKKISNTLKNK